MKSHERLHYMDNIRAIALMLGIIYHASLAYSPFMANIWFTADSQNHAIFDTLSHWLHLFRMPLSFIIAGFFAGHLIEKKGIKSFSSHRLKRLVLPL
jgi:fucose 4-O-acetylase-like acetyltransferase